MILNKSWGPGYQGPPGSATANHLHKPEEDLHPLGFAPRKRACAREIQFPAFLFISRQFRRFHGNNFLPLWFVERTVVSNWRPLHQAGLIKASLLSSVPNSAIIFFCLFFQKESWKLERASGWKKIFQMFWFWIFGHCSLFLEKEQGINCFLVSSVSKMVCEEVQKTDKSSASASS